MKIRLRLSGGFAGLVREACVDLSRAGGAATAAGDTSAPATDTPGIDDAACAELDATARRLWATLTAADAARVSAAAATDASSGAWRDAECCEMELHDGTASACLSAPVQRLDPDARHLLARLRPLARPVRPT